MTMLDLAVFYDPDNWTRRYWEYGEGYTIVRNRHIGLDIARSGRVPALVGGTVVDWADTQAMGRVIIVDVGLKNGKYLSYCHMSKYDMPALGQRLHQGELFGRLATGPKSVGFGHANFPGYSWSGTHLHLVWHNKPGGAYLLNQKDSYNNPENLIREVLSTPAASTPIVPFIPPEEEENMIIVSHKSSDHRNGIVLAAPGHWHKFTGEEWAYVTSQKRSDGKPVFDGVESVDTGSNPRAWDLLRAVYTLSS